MDVALKFACVTGDLEGVVKINPNRYEFLDELTNRSALMLACDYKHVHIAEYLVNLNVSQITRDIWGFTALMLACRSNKFELVQLLADEESVKCTNKIGESALMIAVKRGNVCICTHLIDLGSDVDKKSRWKESLGDCNKFRLW